MKISLSNLLLLTCLAGVSLGWLADRQRLENRFDLEERRLRLSAVSFETRERAAIELASRGDIQDLPFLIYGLGDPNVRIAEISRDAIENITKYKLGIAESAHDCLDEDYLKAFRQERLAWVVWLDENHPEIEFQMIQRRSGD